ncbi:MAG: glycogen/starch/alpha-glucan phosphorylase [Bacteroidetes bacterium]|nr:glycogen/starch/alpha-glucan phosphorylase [Bacteroidota bacterium]MCH8524925.1 glycogen/starch/alpha-glucan phosphorylase [Balneolales bacterium]
MGKVSKIEPRKGLDKASIKDGIKEHLRYTLAKDEFSKTEWDQYRSVVLAIMDRLHDKWLDSQQKYHNNDEKRVYYISMEFLIGRMLDNALINLGIQDDVREVLAEIGIDYDELREVESDAALGNGGLGRLAACFLDSMASLGIAGYGYGIRYDYGIFLQRIIDGYQVERPDTWLRFGNPWDVIRPHTLYPVHFYGQSVPYHDEEGNLRFRWENTQKVMAVAYDMPVPGFKNDVVNNLRLWKAASPKSIDLSSFNQGEYINAVRDMQLHENISRVLYPNDKVFVGQELRLKQEYFLVTATLQDIIHRYKKKHSDMTKFHEKVAIQCNDTHPNLAIPELMRILMDEEGFDWDTSWGITTKTIAYTNHTILPEALEKWPVSLMRNMLPRHLQIIYEINRRFLDDVHARYGDDINRVRRMSIISEGEQPSVQMANLGIVGAHKVNGVAALHSKLIVKTIFKDFYEMMPEKFTNKTNGITPRRWLRQCNPELATAITDKIGEGWTTNLSELKKIDKLATNKTFVKKFAKIKYDNKVKLANHIKDELGVDINPDSIFDVQIKRIHEYKRQLLLAMHTIALYNRIKANPDAPFTPRTVIIAGKAAPGYTMAKLFIKFINSVGDVINNDPEVGNKLKMVFLPNYSVSLAEKIIPAADLSEQISTAGMEASGTGNMKFALNGAVTIGTLDGANVEIKEEVGDENIYIFGLKVEEIDEIRQRGYNPWDHYHASEELRKVVDQIRSGFFTPDQPNLFDTISHTLLDGGDYYMLMADFDAYVQAQKDVEALYNDTDKWFKVAIHNVARIGKFSSDRTISDYASEIWGLDGFKHS